MKDNIKIAPSARVFAQAILKGKVELKAGSSVWYNATLRGDLAPIIVGRYSNVQDNAVLHVADDLPCKVGNYVTVGHGAILHACTVENECLIGMHATVLDGAVIGKQSIVGAGALVTKGTVVPAGSLVLGVPAKVVRALTEEERKSLYPHAMKYNRMAEEE